MEFPHVRTLRLSSSAEATLVHVAKLYRLKPSDILRKIVTPQLEEIERILEQMGIITANIPGNKSPEEIRVHGITISPKSSPVTRGA